MFLAIGQCDNFDFGFTTIVIRIQIGFDLLDSGDKKTRSTF